MQLGAALTRFQAGIPLASQLTAARLNAMMDEIEASRMRQGVGYGFSRDSGGTSLTIASQVQAQQSLGNWIAAVTGYQWTDPFTPNLEELSGAIAAAYTGPNNLGTNITPSDGDVVMLGDPTSGQYAILSVFCTGTTSIAAGSAMPSVGSSQFAWWTGAATTWYFFMAAWPTYSP
jgi:hypothetical protein